MDDFDKHFEKMDKQANSMIGCSFFAAVLSIVFSIVAFAFAVWVIIQFMQYFGVI